MASFSTMFAHVVTVGIRAYALTKNERSGLLTLYRTYAARIGEADATLERRALELTDRENCESCQYGNLTPLGTWQILFQCDLYRDPEVHDRLTVLNAAAACGDDAARELIGEARQ